MVMKDTILRKLMQTDISFGEMEEFENYLNELEKDRAILYALEENGVDNWCGYADAIERVENEEEE
jgi:hypothetical protein